MANGYNESQKLSASEKRYIQDLIKSEEYEQRQKKARLFAIEDSLKEIKSSPLNQDFRKQSLEREMQKIKNSLDESYKYVENLKKDNGLR